jgi:V8-like Glu-specific endopeptidase
MNIHPFNAIGKLEITFIIQDSKSKEFPFTGTGVLVSTNMVLTSAHNVYHRDSQT